MIDRKLIAFQKIVPHVALALQLFIPSIAYSDEAREYYNGARGLGMGGAQIAVVNDETALLVNPAGLGKIRQAYGTIIDPEMEGGLNFVKLYTGGTITSPFDIEKMKLIVDENRGQPFHAKAQLFPSFVVKNFGLGIHANYTADFQMNETGTEMKTYFRDDLTLAMGFNFRFFDGRVKLGATGKLINRIEVDKTLDPTGDLSLDTHASEGVGISTDVGLNLAAPWTFLPTISAVVRDVGGTRFTSGSGLRRTANTRPNEILQDIDIGMALFPIHDGSKRSTWALEYRSLRKAAEEEDKSKYIHAGYEFNYADLLFFRVGWNQRYWTAGAELASEHMQFQIASYGEEIGTASATQEDRRYLFKFAFRF
jgi:hypothetical protein